MDGRLSWQYERSAVKDESVKAKDLTVNEAPNTNSSQKVKNVAPASLWDDPVADQNTDPYKDHSVLNYGSIEDDHGVDNLTSERTYKRNSEN